MRNKFIGDKAFYRRVLLIALPIILQNLISNFVGMLDNIMVGQLDTAQISAVNIVNNNLLFIFMLCMFGCVSCGGIFTTQFHGSGDQEGIRHTFRFKILACLAVTLLATAIFWFGSDSLIGLYLKGEGEAALAADTLFYGRQYLRIMLIGLIPFALSNAYASTMRECGQPTLPMIAGIIAMLVNLVGNYILIFGHFGAPAMGVAGAAIATVISRFVELGILVVWMHCNPEKNPCVRGLYRSMHISGKLLKQIFIKGLPLLMNEALFSAGLAFLNQSYSLCGLDVVPALSISSTIYNMAAVIFRSLGITVGIITGQMLGAGLKEEEVRDANRKQIALCVVSGVAFAGFMMLFSNMFPQIFATTQPVRHLASQLILISAIFMPLHAYIMPVYFTLRSGGKTGITFLFDCGSIWILMLPLAFCLTRFTDMPILPVYILTNCMDIIKCVVGVVIIRKSNWTQNLAAK